MAYVEKETDIPEDIVDVTQKLWKSYSQKRDTWAQQAQEDAEFRLGRQWTAEQQRILLERGQAPLVVNRIHPAVEAAKALLTSGRPQFRVSPREDSDNRVAQVFNGLLEYMWYISDGTQALRHVIDDYYTMGLGAMMVYIDPLKDYGRGEVVIRDVDPLDVYIDPNCRDRLGDDAENVIISRQFTKEQAMTMYPMYKDAIQNAASELDSDRPTTSRVDDKGIIFPEDTSTKTDMSFGENNEYIRGYERYYKIWVKRFHIKNKIDGTEEVLLEEDMPEYLARPAIMVNGQVFTDPKKAKGIIEQMSQEYDKAVHQARMSDQDVPPPPVIQEMLYQDLVEQELIETVSVPVQRVKMCVVMGDKYLYSRLLPVDHYPIVFFMNIHTRTPYPLSDVRMVKDLQEYINKTRSLIVAHATTSTNTKILIPSGSVDMQDFEQRWAQPGVAIEVDMDNGAPQPIQPTPLPNTLYQNEMAAKQDIDHALGLYELMQGNSEAAPHTYKATVSLDEFGQRKIKSKLQDIETGLVRVGKIAISLMQQLYQAEKIVRIVQPNNSMTEFAINKRLYDDKSGELEVINDISRGTYDVVVVTGSTLPTNRYAQLEMYMDAYEKGIIDKTEVLKKTEVFDIEGVMSRTDMVMQLQAQAKESEKKIKDLEGDLQTRERENYHLKQRAELEKFKADLDKTSTQTKASGKLFEKRLDDVMGQVKSEVKEANKPKK
ncbi:MAG: hypothetical protein CMM33_05005 [Rhodospirillaceae bacterium]|nr:hypothetical protein [Rhodospirillaceae bacterium]